MKVNYANENRLARKADRVYITTAYRQNNQLISGTSTITEPIAVRIKMKDKIELEQQMDRGRPRA